MSKRKGGGADAKVCGEVGLPCTMFQRCSQCLYYVLKVVEDKIEQLAIVS